MFILGLTGSIGMGKSTVAAMLRARGIAVFDADAEVHRLYSNEAVPLVEEAFPGTTTEGRVDRALLAAALARSSDGFKKLEAIVHPMVKSAERSFLHAEAARGAEIAVLEIPLLYETGLDAKVDAVLVVSASPETQRERVLARPGMSDARLDSLLARQMPDDEKRRRSNFVVDTNGSIAETEATISAIIKHLEGASATAYDRFWR